MKVMELLWRKCMSSDEVALPQFKLGFSKSTL
jgi:hypothetical protein